MKRKDINMSQELLVDRIILDFAQREINSLNGSCPQGTLCHLEVGKFSLFFK